MTDFQSGYELTISVNTVGNAKAPLPIFLFNI